MALEGRFFRSMEGACGGISRKKGGLLRKKSAFKPIQARFCAKSVKRLSGKGVNLSGRLFSTLPYFGTVAAYLCSVKKVEKK